MAKIATMENGGFVIEAEAKNKPTECPLRSEKNCQTCIGKFCRHAEEDQKWKN